VVMVDGEATFKQFKADPARFVPCSTNPAHQDIRIGSGQAFELVGRVIWKASRM
jgi:repressor LexA